MKQETDPAEEVDALCKECGHAFKLYVDRVTSQGSFESAPDQKVECPVCGCGNCRIGH
jgi:hypothetical protein